MTALAICWKNVQVAMTPDSPLQGLSAGLRVTARHLITLKKEDEDMKADLRKLYEVDGDLRELFGADD
jgi:phage I-like protein